MQLRGLATVAVLLSILAAVQASLDFSPEHVVAVSCGVREVDFKGINYNAIMAACGPGIPKLDADTCPKCMCAMEQALHVPAQGILAQKQLAAYEQLSKVCKNALEAYICFNADLAVMRPRGITSQCKWHIKTHAATLKDCSS